MNAIQNNQPIIFNETLKNDFKSINVFFIEIASKIAYQYNDIYIHNIATQSQYNVNKMIKDKVIQWKQTKEEIEEDIITIKHELNKPIILVSHIVTYKRGERYILSKWLEEFCLKHNILFINPYKELIAKGCETNKLFEKGEPILKHYTDYGHEAIKEIYRDFINKLKWLCNNLVHN